MSTKPPPPCPPPRPDLETDSSVPPPKPSRAAPPPIPLRPDLGEGGDNNVATVSIPKIPPPTLPKKPSIKKTQGRPEITIVSAQPMSSSGAFAPFVPQSPPAPQAASSPVVSETSTAEDVTPPTKPAPAPIPGPPSMPCKPTAYGTATTSSMVPNPPVITKPAPILGPPPIANKSPGTMSGPPNTIPAPIPGPPLVASKPPGTIPGPPATVIKAPIPGPPLVSSKPTTPDANPGPSASIIPAPIPAQISTPMTQIQPTKSAPQAPSNVLTSPPKAFKATKPREPPQRPKSKPVCEPSLANDPFQVGFQNTEAEKLGEPVAPRRKKNKPMKPSQDSGAKDFGINNSAFQELEPSQIDEMLKADEDVAMKNEQVSTPSKKPKSFPTVIRTKPNGKESPKSQDTSTSYLDDLVQLDSTQVKYSKPTAKPQGKNRPPSPPSQKATQDGTTGSPIQVTSTPEAEPQQAKSRAKPTIIIPKAKKDESKKNEIITSPSDSTKTTKAETKNKTVEEKSSKTKRMPSIIRPNRTKKDKNVADSSRGMPEGQSQDVSQAKPKIIPARKAPPRPSPPKPGPPRPGPPKRPTVPQARTQPPGTVTSEVSHPEHSNKGRATPRPATIGKEKGVEKKQKNIESTVVSSVVATKIEPSGIALYDYDSANPDDLSFKAGDEIFLVKRIDPEWYIGRLGDYEGMMPVKFVEIIEDLPPEPEKPVSQAKVSPETSSLDAIVLYDFNGQSHDELTLYAGETVQLLEMISDDWLKGTCNGVSGMFPSNFVDLTQEIKQKLSQQKQNIKPGIKTDTVVSSGPRCKALYDYHTDNDDDLKFNQNDIIKLTERINEEWLKGEIHGMVGMFPAPYVDIIEDLVVSSAQRASKGSSSHCVAKALHDYFSDTEGDLSFNEGDMISNVNKINEEWFEGELHGQKGIFPAAFVENIEAGHSPKTGNQNPEDNLLPKGKALYDFTAETDQELSFKAGDEILLLRHINSDWMEGELNNHIGQFPTAFVEVLVPLP